MGDQLLGARVVDQRRRPPERGLAAGSSVVAARAVEPVEEGEVGAERALVGVGARRQLVIAHEHGRSVGAGKRGHAVVPGGHEEAVAHALAASGDDPVREALGQGDDPVGVVEEGPEAVPGLP